MSYDKDSRVVLTLDAGGTNLVFSAMKSGEEIVEPVMLSAKAENLEELLKRIIDGFEAVNTNCGNQSVAISFAFPGPADYPNGVIGDLANLPLFRGGVALGPMLKEHFGIPVFINNDGDLFAYGEAIGGVLPKINNALAERGNPKRYRNLLGLTFGTGFGAGVVNNGQLYLGDNSAAAEINRMTNTELKDCSIEETISIRGLQRLYRSGAGLYPCQCPEPLEIFKIAQGKLEGDKAAACKAFESFGRTAANAICNAVTMIDGIVVISGGLAGAAEFFMPALVEEMRKPYETVNGDMLTRLEIDVFNLEDEKEWEAFLTGKVKETRIPFSNETLTYDAAQRIGIVVSKLGASRAVALGAYAYALEQLDR